MRNQTCELEDLERILTDTSAEPIKISYAAIKHITKNFAILIGNGGFGAVYLGGLQNGMIAVKKVFKLDEFSDKKFLDEVTCLRKVNHRNIVRFIGYCADTHGEVMEVEGKHRIVEVQQRLLCFEFVPNGNLHHYLKEKTYGYEWALRYQIIKGICDGLHYIHQKRIYHLDLKPANVLLGANMEPKITDFGVSRCIGEQSTMVTKNFFGPLGYVAPEFIDQQQISRKSDIFSLGVIMINLLTGCHEHIIESWHETIDIESPQMKRCVEIAQSCVSGDPRNRPTTADIIKNLNDTETTFQKDHASQTHRPKINEPRNDPRSSLYQVVQRFRALPTMTLLGHSRVDTLYAELEFLKCLLEGSEKQPSRLSYQLLEFITGNFSEEQKLGERWFGSIHRGILQQWSVVVKKLSMTMEYDDRRFHNEVKTMMLARHKNILQLIGYCSCTEEEAIEYTGTFVMVEIRKRLLCFEYLSSGSLNRYISDASGGLEWRERYQIIQGICEGLHYLHGMRIIHLDLKPSSILLDDKMVPKIAHFCLARRFAENQTQTTTQNPKGSSLSSSRYMAPEYIDTGVITFKTDIYSLGVTIAEILTGWRADFAIEKVLESWKKRLEASSPDTVLMDQIRVSTEISIACIDRDPKGRTDTGRIIEMLVQTEATTVN